MGSISTFSQDKHTGPLTRWSRGGLVTPFPLCLFSVPAAPRSLVVSHISANNVTLEWTTPASVPGLLREYRIVSELLSTACEPDTATAWQGQLSPDCVDSSSVTFVEVNHSATIQSLAKYRYYRFKVAAVTSAGVGTYTAWSYARTLAGSKGTVVPTVACYWLYFTAECKCLCSPPPDPDAPPRAMNVTATSSGLRIEWEEPTVLSGPTSYLVQVVSC